MRARTIGAIIGATAVVVGGLAAINDADTASPAPAPVVAPAVTYGPPITITQGGTYSPTTSGVTVSTSQPVVLENCAVKSTTRTLVIVNAGSNVTIRNCYFEGSATPNDAGYRAVFANTASSITVTGSDFVHIAPFKAAGGTPTISVTHNRVRDVIGDETNCCGGGYAPAFQLSNLTSPSTEIAWNEVVNLPGQSNMEDAVNLFGASGTVANPIRVHDNFVWGAYPLPITDEYSGGGILTGDGGGGTNNVEVVDNQLVGTTNYGIQIGGGNNVRFERNRAVASGLTADGTVIRAMNTNPFWTYQKAPTNSSMSNNVFGWMRPPGGYLEPNNPRWHRVDSWMPACGTNGNVCTGNRSLTANPSQRITYADEQAEFEPWVAKSAGQPIGRRPGVPTTTVPATTTTAPSTTTTTRPPTTTAPTTTTTRPCIDVPSLAVKVCPL